MQAEHAISTTPAESKDAGASAASVPASPWRLVKQAALDWKDDNAPRLGAALAYYTVFSLPPLLVIVVAVAGLAFGPDAAAGQLQRQFRELLGEPGADAIQEMLKSAQQPAKGTLATVVGLAVLLFGASGVFGELQGALNTVWEVKPKAGGGWWSFLRHRFLSIAAVMGSGFLLLVSLVVSAVVASLGQWMGGAVAGTQAALHIVNFALSLAVVTVLFALIFKLLPDVRIAWRDVWIGALVTALLFTVGKFLLGLYIGHSSFGNTYGAAASVIVVLVWVYYTAQIVLLGAEFTQAYARMYGSHRDRRT